MAMREVLAAKLRNMAAARDREPTTSHDQENIKRIPDYPHDKEIQRWLQNIKSTWNSWKKSPTVTKLFQDCYTAIPNPYYGALYIMYHCGDFSFAKPSGLAFITMEELKNWASSSNREDCNSLLTDDIRIKAFTTVTSQNNTSLIKLVFSIYQLTDIKSSFIEQIRDMINAKMYKEACCAVTELGLGNNFNAEDFIIPLVLQDKLLLAEECLEVYPNFQNDMISYLDDLLYYSNGSLDSVDNLIKKLDVPKVNYDKFSYKPLCKLISRLIKKYQVPITCCPNLDKRRKEGTINFLLTKKYIEDSIDTESWREMVLEVVGSSKNLVLFLVNNLCLHSDFHEAVRWAQINNIPYDELPSNLRYQLENSNGINNALTIYQQKVESKEEVNTRPSETFYQLSLSNDSVHLIDTEEKLLWMIEDELNMVNVIGIDTEWKPVFGASKERLSLLQIATIDSVFIVDVLTLDKNLPAWHLLGDLVLKSQSVIKLGFGFENDINRVKEALNLGNFQMSGKGYLDLSILWKKLSRVHNIKFLYQNETGPSTEGLSNLVYVCFGKKLNKDNQFSDWERRPLRDTQKLYAALDAFCLLEIYEHIRDLCLQQDIPFEDICEEIMETTGIKSLPKPRPAIRELLVEIPPKPNAEKVPVTWLKVVCQMGLKGLAKLLRMVGVDTITVDTLEHEKCVEIAKADNRVIITQGRVYNSLYRRVPPAYCFRVTTNTPENQLVEVFNYYNVYLKESDILSRCKLCNCDFFIKVESITMRDLIAFNTSGKLSNALPPQSESFEDAIHNYREDFLLEPTAKGSKFITFNPKNEDLINIKKCQTIHGVHIKVEEIPLGLLDTVSIFSICSCCGKCYWDYNQYQHQPWKVKYISDLLIHYGEQNKSASSAS